MIVETKFELNQKVKIKPFSHIEGRILGFYYSHYGVKYYISYAVNFDWKEAYFYEDELET